MDKKRHNYSERKQREFTRCKGISGLWTKCLSEMANDIELSDVVKRKDDNSWCGGSWGDLELIVAAGGWSEPVPRAREFSEKISTAVNSRGVRPCWRSGVVGAFADVPAYVAGSPDNMRYRDVRADHNSLAPINLWVGLGATQDVDHKDIERRGGLVLAAYLALSRVRRVRVHVFSSGDRGNVIIDLPEVFSIAELCALVASPNLFRRLIVRCCAFSVQLFSNVRRGNNAGSVWPAYWRREGVEKIAEILTPYGYKAGDLILGPGEIGKWDTKTDRDMIDEINGYVKRAAAPAAARSV